MPANAHEIVINELKQAAIREIEVVRGSKHHQVRWKVNGNAPRFITIPGSPSDWRWEQNLRADVRRMLRADGLLVDPEAKSRPKPPDRLTRLEQSMRSLEQRLARLEVNGAQADS